jgi:cobalt-zinc-cadmium efflux system membrane fusion protein
MIKKINIVRMLKTFSLSHFLTFSFSLFLFACTHSNSNDTKAPKQFCITDSMEKKITLDTVKTKSVMGEIILSGKITVDEEKQVKIYPLVSGHVLELKVSLGDYVQQGQLLAMVRSPDAATILNNASTAKFNLEIAKKNMDATDDLYKSGIASEKDYITAQKSYQIALSSYTMSNEILKIVVKGGDSNNVSGYYIKAPISGFIVEKKINPGMEIRSDAGDNLFTILDLKDIWVLANVYETDIEKIKVGYDADVTALSYGDTIFKGHIDKIFNVLNPDTKVLNVRIKLDNPNYLLKPGMFARIVIQYPEKQAMLSVPSSCVMFEENRNFVLRFKGKCNIEMQPITVFRNLNGVTYIRQSNLEENDLIINRNGLYVFNDIKNYE